MPWLALLSGDQLWEKSIKILRRQTIERLSKPLCDNFRSFKRSKTVNWLPSPPNLQYTTTPDPVEPWHKWVAAWDARALQRPWPPVMTWRGVPWGCTRTRGVDTESAKGSSNSRIWEQYGQNNAWHSVAGWHGNTWDRRMFSPGAPEGFWLCMHACAPHTARGDADLHNSPPVQRLPLQREGDALRHRLIGFQDHA
jgi:hypothetical protein